MAGREAEYADGNLTTVVTPAQNAQHSNSAVVTAVKLP